jgi:hypothetical protein
MVVFGSGYTSSGQYRANGNYIYSNQSGGLTLNAEGTNSLYLATNSSLRIIIDSGGNVGIGTTNPSYKLEINGNIFASDYFVQNTSGGGGTFRLDGYQDYLYFYGSSSNTAGFRFGSDIVGNVMQIGTNGNVGIGTTSPDAIFHVAKSNSTGIGGQIVIDNNAGSAVGNTVEISFLTDAGASGAGTRNARILAVNDNAGNGAANMQFHTWNGSASAERVRISNDGNVGIGTTSPGTKLDVIGIASFRGSTNSVDSARFFNTDGNYAYIRTTEASNSNNTWFDATLGATIWLGWDNPGQARTSNTYSQVYIGTGRGTINETFRAYRGDIEGKDGAGTVNYRIVTTGALGSHTYFNYGNVGIGTTSPTYRLSLRTSSASAAALSIDDGSGFLDRGVITTHVSRQTQLALVRAGVGTLGFDITSGGTAIITGQDTSTNIMSMILATGNVGIGNTSPTLGKLQLTGDNNQLAVHTTGTYSSIYFFNGGSDRAALYCSSTETHLEGRGSSGLYFGGAVSQNHMVITSGGNVGIGTTAMWNNEILSVQRVSNGTLSSVPALLRLTNQGSGRVAKLLMTDSAIIDGIICMVPVNSTDSYFSFGFAGYTESGLVVRSNGNVGIGTTSPATKLHIQGSNAKIRITGDTYTSVEIEDGGTGDPGYIRTYTYGTANMQLGEGGTYFNVGNIGIGTTSPTSLLTVSTTGDIPYLTINTTATANRRTRLQFTKGGNAGMELGTDYGMSDSSDFYFYNRVTSGTYMVIGSSSTYIAGDVGIGTTSPAYKLDVSGTIRATGDVIAYSDARVKDNVETVKDALQTVTSLRGVTYTRKDNEDKSRKVGVIAQEVLSVLPEVVQKDNNGNYSVAYGNMVGVLIEAIKELTSRIEQLENK